MSMDCYACKDSLFICHNIITNSLIKEVGSQIQNLILEPYKKPIAVKRSLQHMGDLISLFQLPREGFQQKQQKEDEFDPEEPKSSAMDIFIPMRESKVEVKQRLVIKDQEDPIPELTKKSISKRDSTRKFAQKSSTLSLNKNRSSFAVGSPSKRRNNETLASDEGKGSSSLSLNKFAFLNQQKAQEDEFFKSQVPLHVPMKQKTEYDLFVDQKEFQLRQELQVQAQMEEDAKRRYQEMLNRYEDDFKEKGKDFKQRFIQAIQQAKGITFDNEGRVILIRQPKAIEYEKMGRLFDEINTKVQKEFQSKQSTHYQQLMVEARKFGNFDRMKMRIEENGDTTSQKSKTSVKSSKLRRLSNRDKVSSTSRILDQENQYGLHKYITGENEYQQKRPGSILQPQKGVIVRDGKKVLYGDDTHDENNLSVERSQQMRGDNDISDISKWDISLEQSNIQIMNDLSSHEIKFNKKYARKAHFSLMENSKTINEQRSKLLEKLRKNREKKTHNIKSSQNFDLSEFLSQDERLDQSYGPTFEENTFLNQDFSQVLHEDLDLEKSMDLLQNQSQILLPNKSRNINQSEFLLPQQDDDDTKSQFIGRNKNFLPEINSVKASKLELPPNQSRILQNIQSQRSGFLVKSKKNLQIHQNGLLNLDSYRIQNRQFGLGSLSRNSQTMLGKDSSTGRTDKIFKTDLRSRKHNIQLMRKL